MTESPHLSDEEGGSQPTPAGFPATGSAPRARVTYRQVGVLLPRLLAAVYLMALLSWNTQWRGLVGSDGILPLAETIAQANAASSLEGRASFWGMPSLFLWRTDDAFVQASLYAGITISLLVIAGFIPGFGLLLLWMLHLSIVVTGGVFTGFQWDSLLLECGFLVLFVAPWRWRLPSLKTAPDPPRAAVWLLHWLVFRLMFLSGVVKWAGGDDSWHDLRALHYHFETQPLPNPWAWHFHHLPDSAHRLGCAVMLGIELLLPFGIFLGRWGRLASALGFIGLMTVILISGNYTYFNLLSIILSLCLLDDATFGFIGLRVSTRGLETPHAPSLRHWLARVALIPVLALTLIVADGFCSQRLPAYQRVCPEALHDWADQLSGLRTFNAYGLFQAMTQERPEIILEVSDDGIFWLPVHFKHKPGALDRQPSQVAPHQPRLDWQMWFAALSPAFDPLRDSHPASPNHWYGRFLEALLRHKQPVWDLLEPPPLPLSTVTHVRARLTRYQFTSPEQHQATGHWWRMEPLGFHTPSLSLPTQ